MCIQTGESVLDFSNAESGSATSHTRTHARNYHIHPTLKLFTLCRSKYEGAFENGKRQGNGVLTLPSGKRRLVGYAGDKLIFESEATEGMYASAIYITPALHETYICEYTLTYHFMRHKVIITQEHVCMFEIMKFTLRKNSPPPLQQSRCRPLHLSPPSDKRYKCSRTDQHPHKHIKHNKHLPASNSRPYPPMD